MSVNFESLLDVKVADAKRPEPMPSGTYNAVIEKMETGESNLKKTPYVRFAAKIISPCEDVDKGLFSEYAANSDTLPSFNLDFYISPKSTFMLADFCTKTMKLGDESSSLKDLVPQVVGKYLKLAIGTKPSDDGSFVYNVVTKEFPAE